MAFNQQEQDIIKYGLQNGKTKDQVEQAISKYRLGVQTQQVQQTQVNEPNIIQRVGTDIGNRISNIKDIASKSGQSKFEGGNGVGISAPSAGLQTAKQITGIPTDIIGEVIKSFIGKKGEQVISSVAKPIGEAIANTEVAKKYSEWATAHPEASKNLESALGIALDTATIIPTVKGVQTTTKAVKSGIENATSKIGDIVSSTKQTVLNKTENAPTTIMNKVARLTPSQASKFKQISGGVSHGEYLANSGNFSNPENIIKTEAEKFAKSISTVDNELSKLSGTYKDGAVGDALKSLVDKAKSVSTKSVKSPYLKEATDLLNKFNSEGLTMSEINQAKRLFEKNVRLGYSKLLNPKEVELATNIDNAIRTWQFKKASELGFSGLKELNKQTQISKFIVDNLGKQLTGKNGLNGMSLTDWIMLSGGDPTAVGGLLTKKLFSSKTVQARIAKIIQSTQK